MAVCYKQLIRSRYLRCSIVLVRAIWDNSTCKLGLQISTVSCSVSTRPVGAADGGLTICWCMLLAPATRRGTPRYRDIPGCRPLPADGARGHRRPLSASPGSPSDGSRSSPPFLSHEFVCRVLLRVAGTVQRLRGVLQSRQPVVRIVR